MRLWVFRCESNPNYALQRSFVMLILSRLPLRWLWQGSSYPVSSRGSKGQCSLAGPGQRHGGVEGQCPQSKMQKCIQSYLPTRASIPPLERRILGSRSLIAYKNTAICFFPLERNFSCLSVGPLERPIWRSSGDRGTVFYKYVFQCKSRITSPDLLLGF